MEKNLKYLKHLESIDSSLKVIVKELKKSSLGHVMHIKVGSENVALRDEEIKEIIGQGFMNIGEPK